MGEREILAADRVSSDRSFCYVAFCETLLFLSSFTRFLFKQCGLSPVMISWTAMLISMSISQQTSTIMFFVVICTSFMSTRWNVRSYFRDKVRLYLRAG